MSFLLLAIACVLIRPLRLFLLSLVLPAKKELDQQGKSEADGDAIAAGQQLAEVSGGVWERLSVFEHLEQGLAKNPDGDAVICTFQAANSLDDVLFAAGQEGRRGSLRNVQEPDLQQHLRTSSSASSPTNALWKPQNGSSVGNSYLSNGTSKTASIEHRTDALWQQQRHLQLNSSQNGVNEGNVYLSNGNGHSYNTDKVTNGVSPSLSPAYLTISYADLHRAALRLAIGLRANGVEPESKLVMFIPNGGEFAVLLWACVLARVTYVCLDPASSLDIAGFTDLKHTLRALRPQVVVAPDTVAGRALDIAVAELQLPQPVRVALSRASSPGAAGWKTLAEVSADGDQRLSGIEAEAHAAGVVEAARRDRADRVLAVMFTSGTSGGPPKGCPIRVGGMSHMLHSQAWLLANGAATTALQQAHNSRGIAPAQTLQTWRAGGAVLMTGPGGFDVPQAVAVMRAPALEVSFLVLTPPMVHEFAAALGEPQAEGIRRNNSVKTIQVGGDAVTRDVLTRCAAVFPRARVCVNHGMTEGGGSFVWPFFATPVAQVPFFGEICPVGAVAPGSVVRVWDPEKRRVVRRGQLGELHVCCASIIGHYLGGRSETSFYNDSGKRWFNTGDMAMVDREGLVFILGRRKDLIRRAGVAIMPAAIESSLEAFTGSQTIVVPAQHHVLGAEPFAVLGSYNGKTEADIKAHVRAVFGKDYALGGVASLKQLGLAQFPLNPTHKIIKSEVQAAVLRYSSKKVSVAATKGEVVLG